MTTHFLTRDFLLADHPDCVSDYRQDNFADTLRQCDIAEGFRQDALDLQHELGPEPRGGNKKRLQAAWMSYPDAWERYDELVQSAVKNLGDIYPYGFDY